MRMPTVRLASVLLLLDCGAAAPTSSDTPHRRRLLSWSTSYCYPDMDPSFSIPDPKCEGGVPEAEPCDAVSTKLDTLCKLGDGVGKRGADANRWGADYTFKYCPSSIVFQRKDESEVAFCESLKEVPPPNDWATTLRPDSRPYTAYADAWWPRLWCAVDWHRSWVDGKCIDDTRFLGEQCGGGLECDNSGVDPYDGLHLSCAPPSTTLATKAPTCVPSAFLLDVERVQCHCSWWEGFGLICKDDACSGHPCVRNTGDGNHYCDYQADNDW